jgi:GNAT superfamily N-acetyltransferase
MPSLVPSLRPMSKAEYDGWRDGVVADFTDELVATGVCEPEAADTAQRTLEAWLPGGMRTPDNLLWTARVGSERIGMLWLALDRKADGIEAIVRDLYVEDVLRRRGRGRLILERAEQEARERGADVLTFGFFASNLAARAMCESLGYRVASVTMRKPLTAPTPRARTEQGPLGEPGRPQDAPVSPLPDVVPVAR